MWVMLPVILSYWGIVSIFEKLADKALKPSQAGEWPGCKLVFRNRLSYFSCLFFLNFHLTFSRLSFAAPLFNCPFCVNSSKPPVAFSLSSHSVAFALKIQKHLCSTSFCTLTVPQLWEQQHLYQTTHIKHNVSRGRSGTMQSPIGSCDNCLHSYWFPDWGLGMPRGIWVVFRMFRQCGMWEIGPLLTNPVRMNRLWACCSSPEGVGQWPNPCDTDTGIPF